MAERQYSIILKNETEDAKNQTTAPTAKSSGTDPAEERKKTIKQGAAVVGTAYAALSTVAGYVKSGSIDVVSLRTGYEEKQQKQEFAYSIGKTIADTAVAIGIGAATGGLPGALIGATISVGTTIANMAVHQNQISIARQNENNAIFLNQIRMGAGSNREGKTR